jgi:protein TonB
MRLPRGAVLLASVGLHGLVLVALRARLESAAVAGAVVVELQIVTPPRLQPIALGGAAAAPPARPRQKARPPVAPPPTAASADSTLPATDTAFAASSVTTTVTQGSAHSVIAPARLASSATGSSAAARAGASDSPASLTSPLGLARYYPRRALADRTEGRTLIEVSVRADGSVAAARVVSSSPGGIFDDAARRVAAQLHFAPARRQDRAVDSTARLELVWRLND